MGVQKGVSPFSRVMVAILVWVAVLASLYAVIGIDDTDRQNCPYKSGGNPNASLRIAYFGNPFCIWCLILEPKLERLVEQKGRSFYIQYFDDRYCVNEAEAFGVQAVPFFVFNKSGVITPHAGYIEESDMRSIICQETGDC